MQFARNTMDEFRRIVGTRQVRFGTNATIMTIAFLAILVLINILATRNHVRWDLTAEGAFSLTPESIQIIQDLDQPITITGFFAQRDRAAQDELDSRLREYAARSDRISYRFIDPDVNPIAARDYNITSYGTVVVESGERRQQLTRTDEQAITGALLTVTQETPTTIYFLTGHEERSLEDSDRAGYSEVRRLLEEDNFQVEPLSLVITDTIPLENSVLVVADPQTAFQPRTEQAIADYLAQGGRMLLLSDPLHPPPLPDLLAQAGLAWNEDLLIDQQSELGNPLAPVVIEYPFHTITRDVNGPTVFFKTRTLTQVGETPEGLTVQPLVQSTANSQSVTDFGNGEVRPQPDDPRGPLTFGYSVEGTLQADQSDNDEAPDSDIADNARARLVVIGNAEFASNDYLRLPGIANRTLFRSVMAWLSAQEDQFILPPRSDPVDRSLFLTDGQSRFVFYASTFGLPLLVILAGVWVRWQRR